MKPLRALLYAFAQFRRRHRRFDPYRTTIIRARASLDLTGIRADLGCATTPVDSYVTSATSTISGGRGRDTGPGLRSDRGG